MFEVFDDGKLRVRSPLHSQLEGSQIKALDCVVAVNGNARYPEVLLHACFTDVPAELKLQRDLNNHVSQREGEREYSKSARPRRYLGASIPYCFNVSKHQDCPTGDQLKVLTHIAARLEKELTEERSGMVSTTQVEPLFDLIHGIPGAGKSRVIAWICELFTDVLGWTSGNQFVGLAVQNTMAASIGGSTVHHWGSIGFGDRRSEEKEDGATQRR